MKMPGLSDLLERIDQVADQEIVEFCATRIPVVNQERFLAMDPTHRRITVVLGCMSKQQREDLVANTPKFTVGLHDLHNHLMILNGLLYDPVRTQSVPSR